MRKVYALFFASIIALSISVFAFIQKHGGEFVYDKFETSIRYVQPSTPSGVGSYNSPSTGGTYNTKGWSLMFGGVTTLISISDDGVVRNDDTSSVPSGFTTKVSIKDFTSGEKRIRGSIYSLYTDGSYGYFNLDVRVVPPNFDESSLVRGRSLLDNLLLEKSGSARTTLENKIMKGGTSWVNGIHSGVPNTANAVHGTVRKGALWKDGSGAYTKANHMYPTTAIISRLNFSSTSEKIIKSFYDIEVTLPKIDKFPPRYVSSSITGHAYKNGDDYWVAPNTQVTIDITQHDEGVGNYWQHLRFLDTSLGRSDDIAARSRHNFYEGTTSNYVQITHSSIVVNSASRKSKDPDGRVVWKVTPKTHGKNYPVQTNFYDNDENRTGYRTIGNIRVDGQAPTHQFQSITGAFQDGNDYWVKPNQKAYITFRQHDAHSGNQRQYIRLSGNGIDFRSYHDYHGASNSLIAMDGFTSSHISATKATRQEEGTYGKVQWEIQPKTHGHSYNVQYYYRDNVGNNTNDGVYGVSGMLLRVDGLAPAHKSNSISGASYVNGNDYWVTPNTQLTIKVKQNDGHSGNKYQYLRLLDNTIGGDNIAIRERHAFVDGATVKSGASVTNAHITFDSLKRTSDTADGEVEWKVTPKTHGKTYEVEAYFQDNVDNADGYYQTGKKIKVDGLAPTLSSTVVSGARYSNGNKHWVQPNDKVYVTMRQHDPHSGNELQNIRLSGSGLEIRSNHNFGLAVDHNNHWITSSHVVVDSAVREENTAYGKVKWGIVPKTHGHSYDIQYYIRDKAFNISMDGYITTGHSLGVDAQAPTHVSNSLTGARYVNGQTYWVRPNDSVTIQYKQNDPHSGNKRQYLSLQGNGLDVRSWHNFQSSNANIIEEIWTNAAVSIDSATRVENSANSSVNWKVTPKTHGHNYDLMYYYQDNVDNAVGYRDSGMNLAVDGQAPTATVVVPSGQLVPSTSYFTINYTDAHSGVNTKQYQWTTSTATPSTWSNYTSAVTQSSGGLWYLHYRTTDNVGNTKTGYFGPYQFDSIAPSGIFTPNSKSWTNQNVTVSFNPSDEGGSGVDYWKYRVSTDNGATYGSWSTNIVGDTTSNITLSTQALNKIQVLVYDKAGNSKTLTSGTYHIDKTVPSGAFSPNSATWTNGNVTTSFNPSDTGGSGVKSWKYRISTDNGSTYGSWSSDINGDTTSNITLSGQGLNKIEVIVYDHAGNSKTLTSGVYQIDKTLPSGAFNPNSANWTNQNVVTNFNPSDTGGSGVNYWRYRIAKDGGAYGSWSSNVNGDTARDITLTGTGKWTIEAQVVDVAGNSKTITSGVYHIDQTLPKHTSDTVYDHRYKDGTTYWVRPNDTVRIRVRGADDHSGIRYSNLRIFNGAQDNRSQHDWHNTSTHNNEWMTGTYTDIIGASETYESGVFKEVQWNVKALANSNNQDFTLQWYYQDVANNTLGYTTFGSLKVDGDAPTVAANPNLREWLNTTVSVNLTYTDTRSGVQTREYQWSESTSTPSSWNNYTGTVSQANTGVWYLHYRTVDNVGNVRTGYFGPYKVDKIAPSGIFTPNSAAWTNEDVVVAFDPSDTGGSGVDKWRYRTSTDNGATYGAWSEYVDGDSIKSIILTNQALNRIQVEVLDVAGNKSTLTSGTYHIDKTLPSGTFTPNTVAWTNTNITTVFNPSDSGGSNVARWRYRTSTNDGVSYGGWSSYINGDTNGSITLSAEAKHKIEVEVYDVAGNKKVLTSGTYHIDKTVPGGTFTPNSSDWINTKTTVFNPSDNGGSEVDYWKYQISTNNGSSFGAWLPVVNGDTSKDIILNNNGLNVIQAIVYDNAGNQKIITSGVYKIDNIKPTTPSIQVPATNLAKATFTITPGTDVQYSGVNRTEYKLSGANTSDWVTYKGAVTLYEHGVTTIEARTIDNAGNISNITAKQITITAPVNQGEITILPLPSEAWVSEPVEVTVSHTDISNYDRNVTKTYEITTSPDFPSVLSKTLPSNGKVLIANNGYNYIHVKYQFDDGNTLVKTEGPYKIDDSAYSDNFEMSLKDSLGRTVTGWTGDNLTLLMNIQGAVGQSGVTLQYKIEGQDLVWKNYQDGGIPVTTEGDYRILGRIVNDAGAVSEQKYVDVKIDKTKPSFEAIQLIEAQSSTGSTYYKVAIKSDDELSGISKVELNNSTVLDREGITANYTKNFLTSKPTSVKVFDNAGNMVQSTFLDIPTVNFKNGYDLNQSVVRENVELTIDGSGNISYQLGGDTVACATSPCNITIKENGSFTAINQAGIKTSQKQFVVDNIDKAPTRLIFSGERGDSYNEINFNWNRYVTDGEIKCTFIQGTETFNPGDNVLSYAFNNARNYKYDCVLTGYFDGQHLVSNTITIEPDYSEQTPDEESSTVPRRTIPNEVFVEESRVGTFYYINLLKSNHNESVPLPDELF